MELGNLLFGNSRGQYSIDRDNQELFIEILDKLGFDGYGMSYINHNENYMKKDKIIDEFDDLDEDTYWDLGDFIIRPYYWGDNEEISNKPNFLDKKNNIEINWYKYALRDSYSNEPIDSNYFIELHNRIVNKGEF